MTSEGENQRWQPDILGNGFEMRHISFPPDYSGDVRCTIVRKLPPVATHKAILYIHGYSDYFFQREMAEMFSVNGYAFFAIDLRKYGRSLLDGQKMFQVRDLREYFADIEAAVNLIRGEKINEIALFGHSTGGLTAALYMSGNHDPSIKALILNSPFLDWNLPSALKKLAIPVVKSVGTLWKSLRVHQAPDRGYAESLSADLGGEWHYDRKWKPDILPDPDAAWIRAIDNAQKELRRSRIDVPVLLMHSEDSVRKGDTKEKYKMADAILDVENISRFGKTLGDNVTEFAFTGGLHDLVLSQRAVRSKVYAAMIAWLSSVGF